MSKIAIDTYYYSDSDAYTVGVIFDKWTDKSPKEIVSVHSSKFGPYIPGEFYKRELPCIKDLLNIINLDTIDTIIVDGFVDLPGKSGLGRHLYDEVKVKGINVVGVSKSYFKGCETVSKGVLRGDAKSPIYVNSAGSLSTEKSAELVKGMSGKFKLPTLLKILDKETKKLKRA